jgi:hypothetical protein
MLYDLGSYGLQILLGFSIAFGGLAYLIAGRATTRWLWLIASAGWFIGGLVFSEVLFATATVDQIQPIIDGLAFDEALLGGLIGGFLATVATWLAVRTVEVQDRQTAAHAA